MTRLPPFHRSPRGPGDSAGARGRAQPSLTDRRAAPETPWPSSSTHSGAGSATGRGDLPRPSRSRKDFKEWLDAALGGVCLTAFTLFLIFAAGVLQ